MASASGQQDPLAIVGFVLGLVALVGSFIPCINWFGFLPAIGGLVCSIIALSNAKKEGRPRGLAMAGLICSIIALVWIPLCILVVIALMGAATSLAPPTPPM